MKKIKVFLDLKSIINNISTQKYSSNLLIKVFKVILQNKINQVQVRSFFKLFKNKIELKKLKSYYQTL